MRRRTIDPLHGTALADLAAVDDRDPVGDVGHHAQIVTDLLSQIVRATPTMSRAERRVGDLVRQDVDFAVHAHTRDIAARAGANTSTVTRFCRSVGCDGLRDLKLALAKMQAVGDRYLHPPLALIQTTEAVTEIVSSLRHVLDTLTEQVDGAALQRAATTIAGAERVLIFGGGGGSSMAAMEAENRLFRLGIRATHCNDAQLQIMMAATLKRRDVLILLSITGNYEPIVQAAEVAGQYGGHTIAVTAPDSRLALFDMIAYEVAEIRGEPAMESMRRIKYHLVRTRDADDSKPLGD